MLQLSMFARRCSLAVLAAVVTMAAATPATAHDRLPPAVLQALAAAGVPADAMAVAALPLGHHARPYAWRAQVAMQPASTMKLATSIVALDRLGIALRTDTQLRSAATLQDGVLQGDLVIRGGADPDLDVPELWALLLDLRQQGVVTIAGDLLLDRSLFRPTRTDIGLPPFDETPEFQYNVIPDALELAGNLLPLQIQSAPDGTVRATAVPALQGLDIVSRMQPTSTACEDWEDDWKPPRVTQAEGRTMIELNGGFPPDCTRRVGLQLIDRDELAERLVRALWQGLGGSWAGHAREAVAPPDTRLLARHQSRPWGEVMRALNKQSDNPVTRLLFLLLGVPGMAAEPQATTAELAAREVRRWLAEQHIDDTGLVLDNGSGLSRSERITPWQLASMLAVSWRGKTAADLQASLPVAGVDAGMRNRLKGSPAAGWARLKTGSLRNVAALAGYVRDAQGRPWAVAMMINHDDAKAARPALDAWVDSFARAGPRGALQAPPHRGKMGP